MYFTWKSKLFSKKILQENSAKDYETTHSLPAVTIYRKNPEPGSMTSRSSNKQFTSHTCFKLTVILLHSFTVDLAEYSGNFVVAEVSCQQIKLDSMFNYQPSKFCFTDHLLMEFVFSHIHAKIFDITKSNWSYQIQCHFFVKMSVLIHRVVNRHADSMLPHLRFTHLQINILTHKIQNKHQMQLMWTASSRVGCGLCVKVKYTTVHFTFTHRWLCEPARLCESDWTNKPSIHCKNF